MSEITKLYENAGLSNMWVQRYNDGYYEHERHYNSYKEMINNMMKANDWTLTEAQEVAKRECKKEHSPFTAEKQMAIENIIFRCNFGICELQRTMPAEFTKDNKFVKHYFSWWYHAGDIGYYDEITEEPYEDWDVEYSNPNREEALAGFVNALWDEHLTLEEKQQIKGILE